MRRLAVLLLVLAGCSAEPPEASRSTESQQALDEILLANDWLMHCAGHAEEYCGSFDTWMRLLRIDDEQAAFHKARPRDGIPTREEIGERLRELRETHRVEIVGNGLVRAGEDAGDVESEKGKGVILKPGDTMTIELSAPTK